MIVVTRDAHKLIHRAGRDPRHRFASRWRLDFLADALGFAP